MLNPARTALFERFLGISRLLAGHLDFNAIIRAVGEEISHIIPHDHLDVCIKMVDGKYHIAYECGLDTAWSKQPPALLTGSPIRTLLAGEVDFLLSADACTDPRFHFKGAFASPILDLSLRSRLHVPLKVQGDVIGALSCSSVKPGCYTLEDVENGRAVADLLAPYFFALRAAEQAKRSAVIETEASAREEGLRLGALKLTEALEAERQRIGMDLHDQTLADLTRLTRRMEQLTAYSSVQGEALEPLCRAMQQCMHDLREIIEEAKPTVLQLFGVAEAIENHLERSVRDSGLPLNWQVNDAAGNALADIDRTVATALFRIVQEAVNNAIRHGQPESVNVELRSVEGGVSLEVKDDGRGFDISHDMPGHGIDNMKTRARLISATFEIAANADGRGTTVKLTLPLKAVTAREAAE